MSSAAAGCRRAADAAPGRVHTLQAWARLEAKAGDMGEARRLFSAAAELEPDNVYVLQASLETRNMKSK